MFSPDLVIMKKELVIIRKDLKKNLVIMRKDLMITKNMP